MSTRSAIIKQQSDGNYVGIYCHNDGYPEGPHGVGYKLVTHYNDEDKIQELILLGDISSLGSVIGVKHDFDTHYKKGDAEYEYTTAYHRDRGDEHDVSTGSLDEVADRIGGEFSYVRANGAWHILKGGSSLTLITEDMVNPNPSKP